MTHAGWTEWAKSNPFADAMDSVSAYAHSLFEIRIHALIDETREHLDSGVLPIRYVLVETEEIGQDRANDLSQISIIGKLAGGVVSRVVVPSVRIFHEHAVALGCSYAIAEGIEHVLWTKDPRYAWI